MMKTVALVEVGGHVEVEDIEDKLAAVQLSRGGGQPYALMRFPDFDHDGAVEVDDSLWDALVVAVRDLYVAVDAARIAREVVAEDGHLLTDEAE